MFLIIYTICFKDLVLLKKQSKAHHSTFPRWPFYSSWDSHLFFPQHMVTAVSGPLPFISSSGLESNQFWSIISFIQDSPSLQSLCLAGLTHTGVSSPWARSACTCTQRQLFLMPTHPFSISMHSTMLPGCQPVPNKTGSTSAIYSGPYISTLTEWPAQGHIYLMSKGKFTDFLSAR